MGAINLEQGKTYYVKVVKTERLEKRQTFSIKGRTYYNYVIHIEIKATKQGEEDKSGWVEYYTEDSELNPDTFPLNALQYVKCIKCEPLHCNIVPFDPEPVSVLSKEEIALRLVKGLPNTNYNPTLPEPPIKNTTPGIFNERNLGFVGAWAKDFIIVELERKPEGYVIDEVALSERWGKLTRLMHNQLVGIAGEVNKPF